MRKSILGLMAVTAIASPIVLASLASADVVSSDPTCVPIAAAPAVTHTEYKYVPLKAGNGSTHWAKTDAAAGTQILVNNAKYVRDGNKTRIITDVPAVAGVTCSVTLPEHFAGEGTYSVVVPYVTGVDTFLFGVQGYDEKVAITEDVTVTKAMAGQFWIGHTAQEGYVIANPDTAQWHIDFQFATGPNDVRLLTGDTVSKSIVLPDEFGTEHSADGFPGYYSTKVTVTIHNDSDRDQSVGVMYADQQHDNKVWIERGVFDNWTNSITIPAHSSTTFTFDVWYDAPIGSPAEVPDGLTLDFGVTATPVA